ncbi:GtrA family protein [Gallibacterium genomosp. 3]
MFFNFGIYFSNSMGYIVGIIFSFLLNSIFTFTISMSISRFIKFIVCCGFCYLINLFILHLCLPYYGSYISQIFGMVGYTISGFLINKVWVMK